MSGICKVDSSKTRRALHDLRATVRLDVADTMRAAAARAELAALQGADFKDRTGSTRASIGSKAMKTGFRLFAKYAAGYLENTPKPHVISARFWRPGTSRGFGAKGRKAMTFQVAGKWISKRHVNWRSRRSYTFLRPGMEVGIQLVEAMLPRKLRESFRARGL